MKPDALTQKEFDVLVKCAGMTGSSQDGEALNAIRKANNILLKRNLTWDQLLRGQVTVQKQVAEPRERTERWMEDDDGENIDMMLAFLNRTVPANSSFRDFVNSVGAQWKRKGWLSDKQIEALRKAYLRGKRQR